MSRLRGHEFETDELMAYLDGELEAQRAAELVAHMNHCAQCQALAKDFRQISERVLDFQLEAAPEKIGEVVRAALAEANVELEKETDEPRGIRAWGRLFARPYVLAIAAASVVAIVSFTVWMGTTVNKEARSQQHLSTGLMGNAGSPHVAMSKALAQQSVEDSSADDLVLRQPRASVAAAPAPAPSPNQGPLAGAAIPQQPMIARTASLTITAADYDAANAVLQNLATGHGGYVQEMSAQSEQGSSRSVSATLRVPAAQLNSTLADLKKLGHVESETQENSEVTDQYVDVDARLKNARATEQRLIDLLATRTGKLDDVLDVERELATVRGNIESMDAQRTVLLHRVDYATVTVQLNEQHEEHLNSDSTGAGARIGNALVAGIRYLLEGGLGGIEFLLTFGPSIVFWSLLVLVPAWLLSRKYRWLSRR
jgi:anti-sigma factor RsiW